MASHPSNSSSGQSVYKYGSVDDSEQTMTSHSSSLRRASHCSSGYPATIAVTGEQHRSQQNSDKFEASGRITIGFSRRFAVTALLCGLAFLAGCAVSWGRSAKVSRNTATVAAQGGFLDIGADADIVGAAAGLRPSESSPAVVAEAGSPLEFTALNFYHVRDGKPGQDYPWLEDVKLIEPYRDTTLAVVGAREGYEYRWEVRSPGNISGVNSGGVLGEVQATATGEVAIVVLKQLDENVVILEEVDGDGRVTNRLEETVLVKYVRREIRTLTDDERKELLDAMFQLWAVRVDGGDGKERYGEDYADVYAINRVHFKAAANGSCDHFHDGMGFLVSHSLLTNTFEFSLQLVNPKLTIPYWDFTIETTPASSVTYDPALPYTRSELLSPEWFGTVDLEDHQVKDGRWANTEIPTVREHNPGLLEPDVYGRLRSPWNTNDRRYLSRGLGETCQVIADEFITWPDCEAHYDLTVENGEFYSWVWESMSSPHAPVHYWLGGAIDCDVMYNHIANLVGTDIAESLAFLSVGHRKGLYCNGIWSCEGTASVGEQPSELLSSGTCGCQGYDLTQGDDYIEVMDNLGFVEYYIGDYSEDIQRQVVEILCSGVVNYGEQLQSSSSLDPMFWPMHPTIERLWQFAVLTEQVTEFSWPDNDRDVTLADGTSYTQYVSSYYEECSGHQGSHVFPYKVLDADIDGFEIKTAIKSNRLKGNTLSNREVLTALDPRSDNLNYIYDTFKWDHCVSEGFNFDDAWDATTPSTRKTFFEMNDKNLPAVYTSFQREMAELMQERGDELQEKQGDKPSSG